MSSAAASTKRKRRKREGDTVNSRFLMIAAVGLVAFGLIATPAIASASSPPWWVTAVGAGGGAALGSIGGPIGAVAGAVVGATVADYLYNLATPEVKTPSSNTYTAYASYAGSVYNTTYDQMQLLNSQLGTQSNLTITSYYYFAQSMEAEVPAFLPNSTLNAMYLGWDSGMYAAADNLTRSAVYPLNSIIFNNWIWQEQNSYTTYRVSSGGVSAITGNPVIAGNEFFILPSTNFYFITNSSIVLQNTVNGTKYYINESLPTTYVQSWYYNSASLGYYMVSGNTFVPQIVSANSVGIPLGIYKIISITEPSTSSSFWLGLTNLRPTYTVTTDAIDISSSGTILNSFIAQGSTGMNSQGPPHALIEAELGVPYNANQNVQVYYNYADGTVPAGVTNQLDAVTSIMSNAFNSASAFFNELKSFGYTSASQVPASLLMSFPSSVIPTAMLNHSFNATELQALYYAYLLQLKTWFNSSASHTLKSNMTVDNTTFTNGFVQVYGNLTVLNGTHKTYYNDTWFLPLINLGDWTYRVHEWSNITNGTPDPNWLITSGSDSGTLLNLQDATFYTLAISVNGTSVSSYTIKPVTIGYVLPHTIPIGTFKSGGFFVQKEGPLATWEWILIGLISLVAVAAIFERRD